MTAMSEEVSLLAGWIAEIKAGLEAGRLWRVGPTVTLMSRDLPLMVDGLPPARPRKHGQHSRPTRLVPKSVQAVRRGAGSKRAAKRRLDRRRKLQLQPRVGGAGDTVETERQSMLPTAKPL